MWERKQRQLSSTVRRGCKYKFPRKYRGYNGCFVQTTRDAHRADGEKKRVSVSLEVWLGCLHSNLGAHVSEQLAAWCTLFSPSMDSRLYSNTCTHSIVQVILTHEKPIESLLTQEVHDRIFLSLSLTQNGGPLSTSHHSLLHSVCCCHQPPVPSCER